MPNNSIKQAAPDHAILQPIADRFSPYLYEPREVEREKLLTCLEAARWAASSFNEQPWYFILATRDDDDGFKQAIECLLEANQAWAKDAGALLLTVVSTSFTRNGKPNRVAEHDLGLAAGNLSIQATALGLQVHQMGGVNLTRIRQTYNIPDGFDPVTAITIGYPADPSQASEDNTLADRDKAPRTRKALSEFVFAGNWGDAGV